MNRLHAFAKVLVAATLMLATSFASALSLSFTHPYGELVDRGNVSAHVSTVAAWDCTSSYTRTGNVFTITGGAAPAGPPINCFAPFVVVLPPLPAGEYEVVARLVAANGTVVESATQPLVILPLEGRCNADPLLLPPLYAMHKTLTVPALAQKLASDPVFAARLGNPAIIGTLQGTGGRDYAGLAYPPLVDPTVEFDRLSTSGEFEHIWRNGHACFSAAPPDQIATVLEYFNRALDHYFYTGYNAEISVLDAGTIPGWTRTGKSFRAVTAPGCIFSSGKTLVYRFFGVPGAGPNSHFFTRDRTECKAVDKSRQWSFEGLAFWAAAPQADATCASRPGETQVPLYRVWRPFGDSNHRFTTERAVVAQMIAQGWVDEGVAMCVLSPG